MKGDHAPASASLAHNHHEYTSPMKSTTGRKRPSSRTQDGDWIVETPKRRPPKTNSSSEKKNSQDASIDVNRIIQSVEDETAAIEGRTMPRVTNVTTVNIAPATPIKSVKARTPEKSANNRQLAAMKRESKKKAEQKRQVSDSWMSLFPNLHSSINRWPVEVSDPNSHSSIWFSFSFYFRLRSLLFFNEIMCDFNAIEEIVSSKGTIEKRHFEEASRPRERAPTRNTKGGGHGAGQSSQTRRTKGRPFSAQDHH